MPLPVDFGRLQLLEVDTDITLCCQVLLHLANPTSVPHSGFDLETLRAFWIQRGEGMRVTFDVPLGGNPEGRDLELMASALCKSEASVSSLKVIF
jgi:hypothetical protein